MSSEQAPVARIVITLGEPAGIGPDTTIQIAKKMWPAELIVVGDPELLQQRAQQLSLPLQLSIVDLAAPATINARNELKIIPVQLSAPCLAGQLNPLNAEYVLTCLKKSIDACLNKEAIALVTGPIQKSLIAATKSYFTGHTEFLAHYCNAPEALMLFTVGQLKVALATTHLPLAEVPQAITQKLLFKVIRLLHSELQKKFHLTTPRIAVCGLNPHAGENGYLGRTEIDIIEPVIQQLRTEHIAVTGPWPADTIFIKQNLPHVDVILAMYHDQALPVVKYIGFDQAVNVTLGLPIIRTSVDHGTALDIAGTGRADAGSLVAAVQLAIQLGLKA